MLRFAFSTIGLAALLVGMLAGCTRGPAVSPTSSPTGTPTESGLPEAARTVTLDVPSSMGGTALPAGTRAAGATRLPGATSTPIVMQSRSARATMGKAYTFQLYTHCGISFSVDFDGSFWDTTDSRPSGLGNPIQMGTMTLIDTRHARFNYDKGAISYTRHSGVKTIPYLCI